jgi:hypothetical protein
LQVLGLTNIGVGREMSSGIGSDPFFQYTNFNANQIASVKNVNYQSDGTGSGTVIGLDAKYGSYTQYALNNAGEDSRYFYGVKPDGTREYLGIVSTPSTVIGISRTNITALDNPTNFTLQSIDGDRVVFSNVPISPGPITFTAPAGDYSASALCFVSGTRILTTNGERAIESVEIGDLVVTASGAVRPIVWVGRRDMACAADQAPVRVRAGAFGHGLPARDLLLSPGHPVLVGADADSEGGALVPVMCLINGTTITRTQANSVTYWHVELDAHDILLAEGLPAESYIDLGTRAWFGGADGQLLDPDIAMPGMKGRCRPVAVDGPLVVTERARLDAVFAGTLSAQCDWHASEGILTA